MQQLAWFAMDNDLLFEAEAADRLRISVDTLRRIRASGHGPAWVRIGGRARYPLASLIAWLSEQSRDPLPRRIDRKVGRG